CHSSYFSPSLSGEEQQLDDATKVIVGALTPDSGKFCVAEDTLPGFQAWPVGARDRISGYLVALLNGPINTGGKRSPGLRCNGWRVVGLNFVQAKGNVPAPKCS